MANRNLTTFRSVTQQVVENKDTLINTGVKIAENILRQGEEAKLTEGISTAQLELAALDNKFKIENQGDPTNKQGIAKYKADRQNIYNSIQENVSPLYRQQWQQATGKLNERNDASMQSWGLKQVQVNTVASINNSMENGLTQADQDGRDFGSGTMNIEQALLNFSNSNENISAYAQRNLGETTGGQVVQNYGADHMRSFIAGVSETNPLKALSILDNEAVQNSFTDKEQFAKIKQSVENRALNFQAVSVQQEALGAMKKNAGILNRPADQPFSQKEIFQLSETVSEPTKRYLEKMGGFKRAGEGVKLSKSDKFARNASLTEDVFLMAGKDDVTGEDLSSMQDRIMEELDNGSISKNDAVFLSNEMMIPYADKMEENLSQFQVKEDNWFSSVFPNVDAGFSQLQGEMQDFLVGDLDEDTGEIDIESLSEEDLLFNNRQKIKAYQHYTDALRVVAGKRGVRVADVMRLPDGERNDILNSSALRAKSNYLMDRFPDTKNMKDNFPARIITNSGKSIKTGLSKGTPSSSVSVDHIKPLSFKTPDDAEAYAVENNTPDGTIFIIDGVKLKWEK